MKEVKVSVIQTAGKIDFNFNEIKEALAIQMSAYDGITIAEDEIPKAKSELATLRKIRKAVDDRRKEVKREFCEPLDEFEEKVKELLAEIDKPIGYINDQITMFNEERILKKQERCREIYAESIGEFEKFLPYDRIAKKQWDNATYSENDIKYDISEAITKVRSDLNVLSGLDSEIYDTLIQVYIESGNDLSKAVSRNSQYLNDKQKVVEQVKATEQKVEPALTNPEPQSESAMQSFTDFAQMVRTAKIIIPYSDLAQVKETLSFMGVKYTVEGE